jgi:hypothetical protein
MCAYIYIITRIKHYSSLYWYVSMSYYDGNHSPQKWMRPDQTFRDYIVL